MNHEDVSITFSNGWVFYGKAAAKVAFEDNFIQIRDEEYTVTEPYWVKKSDDIMVYLFAYSWIGNINGKPAHGIGKDTSVIIKENCVWLLLAENSGSDSLINLSTKAIFPSDFMLPNRD